MFLFHGAFWGLRSEARRRSAAGSWYERGDLNPYATRAASFEDAASADSATFACRKTEGRLPGPQGAERLPVQPPPLPVPTIGNREDLNSWSRGESNPCPKRVQQTFVHVRSRSKLPTACSRHLTHPSEARSVVGPLHRFVWVTPPEVLEVLTRETPYQPVRPRTGAALSFAVAVALLNRVGAVARRYTFFSLSKPGRPHVSQEIVHRVWVRRKGIEPSRPQGTPGSEPGASTVPPPSHVIVSLVPGQD